MVGLIDIDVFRCYHFEPNPEIMLLSSYYKRQKEIVRLLGDFKDLKYYDRIFIRKNKESGYAIPEELYNNPKIDFGGLAFTHGLYVQLPEEVLACPPDPTIYDPFVKAKPWKTKTEIGEKNALKGQFLSIHHSKEREITKRRAFIIDGDLSYEDLSTLNSIKRMNDVQKFHFYYPIHLQNIDELRAFTESVWYPKDTPPQFIVHSHIEEQDFPFLAKYFGRRPVIEYIPLQEKIHRSEVPELTEKVVANTIYLWSHNIPLRFKFNPKSRRSEKTELLYCATKWSEERTYQSFEKYLLSHAPDKVDTYINESFTFPLIATSSKNNIKIGGKIHYEW